MATEQQVNQIARKFSNVLIDSGIKMGKSAFHLEPKIIIYQDFLSFIISKLPNVSTVLLDGKYYALSFWQWKDIIEYDWIDLRKWTAEKFDCDDFARVFQAHIFEIFEINTVGTVYGKIFNKDTNAFIDYHYWNCIVSQEENGAKKLYFFESENDLWIEYNGGNIVMGNWRYEPIKIQF